MFVIDSRYCPGLAFVFNQTIFAWPYKATHQGVTAKHSYPNGSLRPENGNKLICQETDYTNISIEGTLLQIFQYTEKSRNNTL